MTDNIPLEDHPDEHDDHHAQLWALALIGVVLAILVLLPNVWFANKQPVKED